MISESFLALSWPKQLPTIYSSPHRVTADAIIGKNTPKWITTIPNITAMKIMSDEGVIELVIEEILAQLLQVKEDRVTAGFH